MPRFHSIFVLRALLCACVLPMLVLAAVLAQSELPVEALRDGETRVAGKPYIKTVAELAADILGNDASTTGLAMGTLRRLTSQETSELLAMLPAAFDAANKSVNWNVIRAYEVLGDVAAERHYADLLRAIDPAIPKDANLAMQKIRPSPGQREAVVAALLEVFDDPATKKSLRNRAATQLIKNGASDRLAVRIEPMLDHPQRKVRVHAVALLATSSMPVELAVPLLEKALDNSKTMVVDHAIGALFSKNRPASAHAIAAKKTVDLIMTADNYTRSGLFTLIMTADNYTRSGLFTKIGMKRAQASSAVPLLLPYLESPKTKERIYAIQALAELKGVAHAALGPLEAVANDADPTVQRFAAKAIECISETRCRDLGKYRREAAYLP